MPGWTLSTIDVEAWYCLGSTSEAATTAPVMIRTTKRMSVRLRRNAPR